LHKGGCRPDPRGDRGVHRFTYSLLVHESAFSAEAVIRPAYELNYPVLAFDGVCARDARGSLLSVDAGNVIIETVKPAEDKEGVIVRAYEAEGTFTNCKLTFDAAFGSVFITDMLEYENEPIDTENNTVLLDFKPFEIKTLRLKGNR
ncbi:MAG: alpha-mannosidase, partial [Clostridia bacterium]|nr:alpha-mannosidase [Clostridia bacterium]